MEFVTFWEAIALAATVHWIIQTRQDSWLIANGGTEEPFRTRRGYRLLYCWQPLTGQHAYLNCDTDLFLSEAEVQLALGY